MQRIQEEVFMEAIATYIFPIQNTFNDFSSLAMVFNPVVSTSGNSFLILKSLDLLNVVHTVYHI